MSLGQQLKKKSRSPASAPVKDLRFSEEENLEDASLPKPVSAQPQFEEPKIDQGAQVHFGTVDFSGSEMQGDEKFHSMTEKIKQGFMKTRKQRMREQAQQREKQNQKTKGTHLANAQDVMNMNKKTDHNRVLATEKAGVSRGSEFIFHSMCKHIDSYEKSNQIDLGTSVCPGR